MTHTEAEKAAKEITALLKLAERYPELADQFAGLDSSDARESLFRVEAKHVFDPAAGATYIFPVLVFTERYANLAAAVLTRIFAGSA